jgi:hypothetical protein
VIEFNLLLFTLITNIQIKSIQIITEHIWTICAKSKFFRCDFKIRKVSRIIGRIGRRRGRTCAGCERKNQERRKERKKGSHLIVLKWPAEKFIGRG